MAAVLYEDRFTYRGTEAEKTALTGMRDKDAYIEIDTGKVYFYDAANSEWIEFTEG
jgi:hypothetical protein